MTAHSSKTLSCWYGLIGRSISEMARTALGPNRHPTRNGEAVSNGIPRTATSTPSSVFVWGSRMKVVIPQKRGVVSESWGRKVGIRTSAPAAAGGALHEELEEGLGGPGG